MDLFWTLAVLLAYFIQQGYGYCDSSTDLVHGSAIYISEDILLFECDEGYSIRGRSVIGCSNGLLRWKRPFCARPGCIELVNPPNGKFMSRQGIEAEITCDEGYVLVGNRITYCDGEDWNFRLGSCQKTDSYSCDFESEDLCGWTFPHIIPQPWRWISTATNFHSNRTGSLRDHTYQTDDEGHFIRMETESGAAGRYHFFSPEYARELSLGNSTCFQFHFFMFGEGVGGLLVSQKPASMSVADMMGKFEFKTTKFQKFGSLSDKWYEHSIPIDEMEENFQIIFTVTDAESRFGDIAIDDVKFLRTKEECKEAFIIKDPSTAKAHVHSGVDSTNKWQIYYFALLCWVVIIMLF